MKMLIRTLTATLLICLLTAAVLAQDNPPKPSGPQSEAKKAFEKLKTLAARRFDVLEKPKDSALGSVAEENIIIKIGAEKR